MWILFAALHILSIGFAFLTFSRMFHYIQRYRFDESKYTLLFGFVHLRWIATLYLGLTLAWLAVSFLLMLL